jgi:hypothetical protein
MGEELPDIHCMVCRVRQVKVTGQGVGRKHVGKSEGGRRIALLTFSLCFGL